VLFSSHPAGSRVRTVIIRDLSRRDALERELAHTQSWPPWVCSPPA
jgi:hypothetical protein